MVNFSVHTAYNKHNTALKVFYRLFTHSRLLYENLTRQTALTCLTPLVRQQLLRKQCAHADSLMKNAIDCFFQMNS